MSHSSTQNTPLSEETKILKARKPLEIRFSEVDSMKVVWHGSYILYWEDAREYFGRQYGLGYEDYLANSHYAPIVEMQCKYKRPLFYGRHYYVDIIYRPTRSAKVVFDYEIHDAETGELMAEAHTVQVFTDMNYELVLLPPDVYQAWQQRWGFFAGETE